MHVKMEHVELSSHSKQQTGAAFVHGLAVCACKKNTPAPAALSSLEQNGKLKIAVGAGEKSPCFQRVAVAKRNSLTT